MIEIETKDWPTVVWWEMIEWCSATFGPCDVNSWWWQDDYSLYMTEENITLFSLRWM